MQHGMSPCCSTFQHLRSPVGTPATCLQSLNSSPACTHLTSGKMLGRQGWQRLAAAAARAQPPPLRRPWHQAPPPHSSRCALAAPGTAETWQASRPKRRVLGLVKQPSCYQ